MSRTSFKSTHRSSLTSAVISCFFLTGAAGLIYQVLWLRMIDKVIGSAPFAVSTVLTVFMGGLALGSYLAGRHIDRIPSRSKLLSLYGKIEMAIGIYGLLFPFLISAAKPIYSIAYNFLFKYFWLYQLFSFLGCSILLLIPTTLMGVSLPVLCRFYVSDLAHLGTRTGRLYGINTFGSVAGALLCGFFLIAEFGVWGSLFTAVGINILVGILCIGLARRYLGSIDFETTVKGKSKKKSRKQTVAEVVSTDYDSSNSVPWALLIFCISGFCAMAYEVFWTRLLGLIIGPTTYSFTLVVSTFIFGLALGSVIFGWLADRLKDVFRLLIITQVFAACLALLISQFIGNSQFFFSKLIYAFQDDFGELVLVKSVSLFFILIGPTIFLGATFPLVNKIYARSLSVIGKSIGTAYAINTMGAILGSFFAGYILIPFLGKENGLRLVIGLQLAVALMAYTSLVFKRGEGIRSWIKVSITLALGVVLLINFPSWNRSVLSSGWYHRFEELEFYFNTTSWPEAAWKGSDILAQHREGKSSLSFYGDGVGGFTTVERDVDSIGSINYSLYISGKADASTHLGDRLTQTLLAHVPMLFHPNPEKVMVLGLASGMTAGEALLYPVKRMDVLEINDQVLKACELFTQWNNGCLTDPNTRIIVQDGRNHLELTREKYNVIISEPSNPWMAGLANLFTLDFFESIKERLSENGTFVQWIHSYEMDWSTFAMVGRTFGEVFPDGLLINTSSGDFLLVGFKGQKNMDLEVAYNNVRYAGQSTNITIRDPRLLFHLIVTEDLKGFFGSGPLHTDNRPRLEFAAPKNLDKSDVSITERVKNDGRLSSKTLEVVESSKKIDSLLDMLELSLAKSSPSFDIVDINELTSIQKKRYQNILNDYCSNVFVDNYEMFPNRDIQARCAHIQVSKIKDHMASGREDGLIYYNLAVAYRILGDTQEEIDTLRKAINLDPSLYEAHNDLGIALSKQGRFEEAIIQLSKALEIRPGYTEALNNLGNVFATQGKTVEAMDYYSKAIRIDPDDTEVLNNLGNILAAQGKIAEAMDYYSKAIRIDPDSVEAHYKLGHIFFDRGRFDDAMTHFYELLRIDYDNADFHSEVGAILAAQGEMSEAKEHFNEALRINPNHLSANYNMALALAEQQQFKEAADHLFKAIETNPYDPEVHNMLGVILGSQGRFEEALDHFSEALKFDADNANVYDNMGLALLQMGQLNEAAVYFSKALEIDSSFSIARNHMEMVHREIEKNKRETSDLSN